MNRIATKLAVRRAVRALIVPVMLVVFGAGAARAYDRDETFTKRVPLQGAKRVFILNSRGDVKVIGEKGRGDISCEYTKRIRGRSQEEADRLFNLTDVDVEREDGGIKISIRYPDQSRSDRNVIALLMQRYEALSVDVNVMVPAELDVKIITASGDVQLASVAGPSEITTASGSVEATGVGKLKIDASSGDMTVSGVAGNAFLSSASGDIEAHHVSGDAAVRSASGDITLSEIGGDLTAASTSGDVTVNGVRGIVFSGTSGSARFTGVRGQVSASAASGDVEVTAAPVSAVNYEIRTSSGQIELKFENAVKGGFALKAQTTSGDISVTLPIKVTKVTRHYLTGVVREGKSVVVLETASGDITVSEPEE
ncbi:MAG: DUF4097 family beta strand repeat-containing protein [Candidatus Krumholzibacteriaceae bacterium]|jgi:DUF4097 and DUF4098 domain-containing protein YvlB